MALLENTTLGVADSYVMACSIWFYGKSSECSDYGGGYFFEFGDGHPTLGSSYVGFDFLSDRDQISSQICSGSSNQAIIEIFNPDGSLSSTLPTNVTLGTFIGNPIVSDPQPVGTYRDKWVHAFFTVDMSTYVEYAHPSSDPSAQAYLAPTVKIYVNRVNRFNVPGTRTIDPALHYGENGGHIAGFNRVNPISTPQSPDYAIINPYQIPLNGFPFGHPLTEANITGHPPVRYAEVKIWFNKYIDPAVHISKFIDARGKPVDPAAAISAFGLPSFHLRRNKKTGKTYVSNEGSAGALTEIGTIEDFTPDPF